MRDYQDEVEQIRAAGLYRELGDKILETGQGTRVRVDGREMINFSSNDYLGLADSKQVLDAFVGAAEKYGVGSGASRLVCGSQPPHRDLEDAVAAFLNKERALVFATGFGAASGVLGAVLRKGDVAILDKLCHASLVDGARASGATMRVFPHGNLDKLESHLAWAQGQVDSDGRVLVITEAVFSMDGDRAPLKEIVALKQRYGASLLVDEAHAVGIIGPEGRGLAHAGGVADEVDLLMGTLGKAAGVAGGFVAARASAIECIVNRGRSFIYSTAPPPAQAAAATEGLRLIESAEGDRLRDKLWANLREFGSGVEGQAIASAIVPWLVGDEARAMELSESLRDRGYLIPAIRFPTVPKAAARLRITFSAKHTAEEVGDLRAILE